MNEENKIGYYVQIKKLYYPEIKKYYQNKLSNKIKTV